MITKELPPHAVIRPLTLEDLDQFLRIEEACFPPAERCTKEKYIYRLTQCPELSCGVFIRRFSPRSEIDPDDDEFLLLGTSSIESETLIGHILGTKMASEFVTDDAMEIPAKVDKWGKSVDPHETKGHIEDGKSIGIHSVCVDPAHQGKSIGLIMLKDYVQRMTTVHNAERISIIVHNSLIPFYQKIGFVDRGESSCQFGEGGWKNMTLEILESDEDD